MFSISINILRYLSLFVYHLGLTSIVTQQREKTLKNFLIDKSPDFVLNKKNSKEFLLLINKYCEHSVLVWNCLYELSKNNEMTIEYLNNFKDKYYDLYIRVIKDFFEESSQEIFEQDIKNDKMSIRQILSFNIGGEIAFQKLQNFNNFDKSLEYLIKGYMKETKNLPVDLVKKLITHISNDDVISIYSSLNEEKYKEIILNDFQSREIDYMSSTANELLNYDLDELLEVCTNKNISNHLYFMVDNHRITQKSINTLLVKKYDPDYISRLCNMLSPSPENTEFIKQTLEKTKVYTTYKGTSFEIYKYINEKITEEHSYSLRNMLLHTKYSDQKQLLEFFSPKLTLTDFLTVCIENKIYYSNEEFDIHSILNILKEKYSENEIIEAVSNISYEPELHFSLIKYLNITLYEFINSNQNIKHDSNYCFTLIGKMEKQLSDDEINQILDVIEVHHVQPRVMLSFLKKHPNFLSAQLLYCFQISSNPPINELYDILNSIEKIPENVISNIICLNDERFRDLLLKHFSPETIINCCLSLPKIHENWLFNLEFDPTGIENNLMRLLCASNIGSDENFVLEKLNKWNLKKLGPSNYKKLKIYPKINEYFDKHPNYKIEAEIYNEDSPEKLRELFSQISLENIDVGLGLSKLCEITDPNFIYEKIKHYKIAPSNLYPLLKVVDNSDQILNYFFKNEEYSNFLLIIYEGDSPKVIKKILTETKNIQDLTGNRFNKLTTLLKNNDLSNEEIMNIYNNWFNLLKDSEQYDCMLQLIQIYNTKNIKSEEFDILSRELEEKALTLLSEKTNISKQLYYKSLEKIKKENRNPLVLGYLKTPKEVKAYNMLGAPKDICSTTEYTEFISSIPSYILEQVNKKQLDELTTLFEKYAEYFPQNNQDQNYKYPLRMYLVLGYERSKDLLTKKYGNVSYKTITSMFNTLNFSNITFSATKGMSNAPLINEKLVNLYFNKNYKVDSIIKQSANGEKVNPEVFEYFMFAVNNWDIIEQEFLNEQAKSTLKLKLNITKVIEISKLIISKRNMPKLKYSDYPLKFSDVFSYSSNTQFVRNPEKVPSRIIELSRRMEKVTQKKFPDINFKHNNYSFYTYNPQDRNILSAGYRSHCCFRAMGNADDFGNDYSLLNYCISTEYGGAIDIKDSAGKTVMFSPILRNGNVLIIHSVETNGFKDKNEKTQVHEALVKYANLIIEKSKESGDNIDFVLIGGLHNLNTDYTKGTLANNRFYIFDEDNSFKGMYTNLDEEQKILATSEDKTLNDITYGSVKHSYDFPKLYTPTLHISFDEIERQKLTELQNISNQIIILSNKKFDLDKMQLQKEEINEIAQINIAINNLKKQRLEILKELYQKGENKKDSLYEYNSLKEIVSEISGNSLSPYTNDFSDIAEAQISENYYIIKTTTGEIYHNYSQEGKQACIETMKNFANIEENLSNEEEIKTNGKA